MARETNSVRRKQTPAPKRPPKWRVKLRKGFKAAKQFCRNWHINHLAPIPFIGLYMLIGAIIFWWAEKDVELENMAKKRVLLAKIHSDSVIDFESLLGTRRFGQRARLVKLIDELIGRVEELYDAGIGEPQWTFMTAMYFSGTLFTTIGYGDIACETAFGRICTVIYSVIGIPLTLITLNELGKFLYKCINEFMASFSKHWNNLIMPLFCCVRSVRRPSAQTAERLKIPLDPPMTPTQRRQSIKEQERKMTHFFKDQRIAQRELVFEYDLKGSPPPHDADSQAEDVEQAPPPPPPPEKRPLVRSGSKKEKSAQQQLGILGGGETSEGAEAEGEEVPRMHVLVAIFFTVSWLFFCSALFKYVEDWPFGDAFYFVCISLLTVGLGDVKVSRREYMVLFFAFVMIGLSLVSMCINVIQNSIEDFYKRLLMQMLEQGDPNSLRNNRLAKLLLPLLSKEKKDLMMRRVQEEAQRSGMIVDFDMANLDQMFKKESIASTMSSQPPPSEPMPPTPLEIVIEPEMDELDLDRKKLSLQVPFNYRRRDSFQLVPQQMKLIPFIDKELQAEEEEKLIRLELNIPTREQLDDGGSSSSGGGEDKAERRSSADSGKEEGEESEGDSDQ